MTTANEPTARPRSRRPLGLLGMLALVAATERYIEARNVDLGTMYTIEWRLTSKAVTKQAPKAEILCFGTSLNRLGLSPLILEERTGRKAYNFSLSGGQPYATFVMLRHALAAGARPKAIVVDYKWTSVSNSPIGLERILPEMGSLAECVRLGLELRDSNFLGKIAAVELLPSYACRVQIRDNIAAAIEGKEPVRNEQWTTVARNMRANKGSFHVPRGTFDGAVESRDGGFFLPEWTPDPVNGRYVHKFLALAESLHVPIFVVISPISPATRAKLDEVGVTARYTKFIDDLLAKYPNVVALDARGSGYPAESFADTSHLNRFGTADFSNAVADAVKAKLDGAASSARIVALPAYAGGKGQERLEDSLGSYELVATAKKAKESRRVAARTGGDPRR